MLKACYLVAWYLTVPDWGYRYCLIKYHSEASAHAALTQLNGTDICGVPLIVSLTDPVHAARNSKRPRVAE